MTFFRSDASGSINTRMNWERIEIEAGIIAFELWTREDREELDSHKSKLNLCVC